VALAWIDAKGRRRVPLAFLPYFADGEENLRHRVAQQGAGLDPFGMGSGGGFCTRGGAVRRLVRGKGSAGVGWSFVTRLRANRLLEGIQLRRHGGAYWVKVGHLKGLSFAVQVVRRGRRFYASSGVDSEGKRTVEVYRLRQGIEEIFRGHRHWRRAKVLGHLALGLVAYGLIECQREQLKSSFYQCRRRLITGKLSLDLSPLWAEQTKAA